MTLDAAINQSHTWREIRNQPGIWRGWANDFDATEMRGWVKDLDIEQVWFCGAGTSAYIGDILAAGLNTGLGPVFRSVPSTDIVAQPHRFLASPGRVLIVNFGRSGDSTESIGTLDLLRNLAPTLPVLNITCNSGGMLAKATSGRNIILPTKCHDVGFAMTSSFTTMFITALAVFSNNKNWQDLVMQIASSADEMMLKSFESEPQPARAVYVGAGAMAFAARESALKVMELSAGKIPAIWDTTLGFRHGPKSFIQENTAIHVLLSSNSHTAKYDKDLVTELRQQFPKSRTITIGKGGNINFECTGSDLWNAPLSVIPAQLQSVAWSAGLGLNIDDPFVGQSTLSRVVSSVRIHPVGKMS